MCWLLSTPSSGLVYARQIETPGWEVQLSSQPLLVGYLHLNYLHTICLFLWRTTWNIYMRRFSMLCYITYTVFHPNKQQYVGWISSFLPNKYLTRDSRSNVNICISTLADIDCLFSFDSICTCRCFRVNNTPVWPSTLRSKCNKTKTSGRRPCL